MGVNALSFVAFLSLLSTGTILHFLLPPGSGSRGAGARRFFSLTRHEWGDVHFYIAVIFLILLAVHLILHWNWLYAMAWGSKANPQPAWKRLITILMMLYMALTAALPFMR